MNGTEKMDGMVFWDGMGDWEIGRENMGLIWKEFLDNLLKDATTSTQHQTKDNYLLCNRLAKN